MATLTQEDILNSLDSMTVLQLNDLVKALEEKFGVSAAAPIMMAGGAAGGAAAAVEEQSEFDVILESPGEKKIQVLKVVREATGLGLKEAKDLVDNAPKPVKEKIKKEDAEKIKAMLEAEGAKVSIK